MEAKWLLVLLVAVGLTAADGIVFETETEEEANKYSLPKGFLFGAGTSSYQSEGAWNDKGKGINVFDHYYNFEGHDDEATQQGSGNVGADAYHHIDDDIAAIEQLKLQVYRFSISWARVLPDGDPKNPNADGVRYYKEIIDKLIKINVEPLVTLYHFDHPYSLHEKYDSWLGAGMIDAFLDFADFAFQTFGDKVKMWTTLNEPNMYCLLVYGGVMAPGNDTAPIDSYYNCLHHQLLAHGKTFELYKTKYAASQGGKIGLTYYSDISRPNSTSPEDIEAASRANTFRIGIVAAPVVFGDYPEIVKTKIEEKSKAMKVESWLREFTETEKLMMKGSADFIGLNIYFGTTVADATGKSTKTFKSGESIGLTQFLRTTPLYNPRSDCDVVEVNPVTDGGSGIFGHAFSKVEPWALRASLVYAKDNYNISIFITENGYEDRTVVGIHDQDRAAYHSTYLRAMIDTIKDHKMDVFGMTVWTLIDDLEWSRGHNSKMGLVHVDYLSPTRTRTLKDSSAFFIKLQTDKRVPLVKPTPSDETTVRPTRPTSASASITGSNHLSGQAWCHLFLVSSLVIKQML